MPFAPPLQTNSGNKQRIPALYEFIQAAKATAVDSKTVTAILPKRATPGNILIAVAMSSCQRGGGRFHDDNWRDLYWDVLEAEGFDGSPGVQAHYATVEADGAQTVTFEQNTPADLTLAVLEYRVPSEWLRGETAIGRGRNIGPIRTRAPYDLIIAFSSDFLKRELSILDFIAPEVGPHRCSFAEASDSSLAGIVAFGAIIVVVSCNYPGNGTVGVAYTQTVTASGGRPPYTFAITAGALPTGLSLNAATGVISGTPTTAGTSTFTVQATDSTPITPVAGHVTCSITISAAATALEISLFGTKRFGKAPETGCTEEPTLPSHQLFERQRR